MRARPAVGKSGGASDRRSGAHSGDGDASKAEQRSLSMVATHNGRRAEPTAAAALLLLLLLVVLYTFNGGRPAPRAAVPEGGAAAAALSAPLSAVDDALLRAAADACSLGEETYVFLEEAPAPAANGQRGAAAQTAVVVATADSKRAFGGGRPCPLVDIMLGAEHRSIGLCTDAALYMQLLGARLLPGPGALPLDAYAAACPPRGTARMGLEAMHEEWLDPPPLPLPVPQQQQQQQPSGGGLRPSESASSGENGGSSSSDGSSGGGNSRIVRVLAPNFENAYASDRRLHALADLVLCKARRCAELFGPYLRDIGAARARVVYTGHTAVDPAATFTAAAPAAATRRRGRRGRAGAEGGHAQQQQPAAELPRADYAQFLHVRGKSGLKHTAELLACWARHPEWPTLTVVGPLPNPQVNLTLARRYLAAPNIRVPKPGTITAAGWPEFDPLTPAELAALQLRSGVHICPSEREGYGLYIAEARAAGALVLTTDHAPMNEQVGSIEGSSSGGSSSGGGNAAAAGGILIAPERTFSHEGPPAPALASYGDLSASVSPDGICAAVAAALALPGAARAAAGAAARAGFVRERAAFERRMAETRALIASLLAAAGDGHGDGSGNGGSRD